jgi:crotonobetainyl-CoA:carnitine CoA-transferase CaiB-like acyl-CoA transferase
MKPALAGYRVIELGTMLAAPFAGHMLAQLGAEVLKVEPPAGDPTRTMLRGGASGSFIACNRGKRSVCIDLKTSDGQAALHRLIATADIVIHNLAPHSTRHLTITHADCLADNPKLIYCHIQGYGAGPLENEIASNPVVEASTGVMYTHRVDGRPSRLGPSYHDQFAGAYAVIGILAALNASPDDLNARCVEVGLYETGLHLAGRDFVGHQLKRQLGVVPEKQADEGEFSMPGYGAYETADGRWMYLIMLTDGHWSKFCQAMALLEDPSLTTIRQRKKKRPEVDAIVKVAIGSLPFDVAAARLRMVGFGCTEVKASEEVLNEPQARQPGKLQAIDFQQFQFAVPNLPLPHQRATLEGELPPPLLGQHTIDALRSIGYGQEECAALLERGVIAVLEEVGTSWAPARPTRAVEKNG